MNIMSVKIDSEGDVNATFTLTTKDGSVLSYWSCDQGFPEPIDLHSPDLSPKLAGTLQTMWNEMTISSSPRYDGVVQESWKRDFSEWKKLGEMFVMTKEWSEECD